MMDGAMIKQMNDITMGSSKTKSCENSRVPLTKLLRTFRRKSDSKILQLSNHTIHCAICKETSSSDFGLHLDHCSQNMYFGPQWTEISDAVRFELTLCFENTIEVRNVGEMVKIGHFVMVNGHSETRKPTDFFLEYGKTQSINVTLNQKSKNAIYLHAYNGNNEFIVHFVLDKCCINPAKIVNMQQVKKIVPCEELMAVLGKPEKEITSYFKSIKANTSKIEEIGYKSTFSKLSMIERVTDQLELAKYQLKDIEVKSFDDNTEKNLFEVYVKNVKDNMSELTTSDLVYLKNDGLPNLLISANIRKLTHNHIVFKPKRNKENCERESTVKCTLRYNMTFYKNGYSHDMEMAALDFVHNAGMIKNLFPNVITSERLSLDREFDWINPDISSNQPQQQAVHHIVKGTSHPAPYILFGPPGTGKTKTLVEAISQIYIQNENSRILVCATSNAAADELASRLVLSLSSGCWFGHHVYRLYSNSYEPEIPIENRLRRSSNFDLKYIPQQNFLQKFRIIVATLLIGGSLRFANFEKHYFTHLFIDECGSATEIATLLPIASAPHANIVLSGDPKQLGPVIVSKHASDLGLGTSLLERLMETKVYQKDTTTNNYNPNALTKLVYNYRSHPAIIERSNTLFYGGELQARGNKENTHCFVNWNQLPSKKIPIVFHACVGHSEREKNSTSIFNMAEVNVLLKYVELVMKEKINNNEVQQEDIGIISPYKKQCHKIKDQLRSRGFEKIMVATVDMFQGQEKPIILVSTTRCKMGGVGFLKSPQRLNVLLTRAKCLMIIIGDPNTLKFDKNWRKVLIKFREIGVCTGEPFSLRFDNTKNGNATPFNKPSNAKSGIVTPTKAITPKIRSASHVCSASGIAAQNRPMPLLNTTTYSATSNVQAKRNYLSTISNVSSQSADHSNARNSHSAAAATQSTIPSYSIRNEYAQEATDRWVRSSLSSRVTVTPQKPTRYCQIL